jgi:hypothetical protein
MLLVQASTSSTAFEGTRWRFASFLAVTWLEGWWLSYRWVIFPLYFFLKKGCHWIVKINSENSQVTNVVMHCGN